MPPTKPLTQAEKDAKAAWNIYISRNPPARPIISLEWLKPTPRPHKAALRNSIENYNLK